MKKVQSSPPKADQPWAEKSKHSKKTTKSDGALVKASNKTSSEPASTAKRGEPTTMEELLSQYGYDLKGLKKGDTVNGTIVFVSPKQVRIDVGGKTEAVLHDKEVALISDLGDEFKPGTAVKALIINSENDQGQPVVSLRQAMFERRWDTLAGKQKTEEIITVMVNELGKGGFLIQAFGLRGFLPFSQADQALVALKDKAYGRKIKVKVLEVDKESNRLVVSQRFAGQEGILGRQVELLEKIKSGEVYEVEISGVVSFGAFAKLTVAPNEPSIEGLIHISEIAWEKVEDPNSYVKTGSKVKAKVIGVDKKSGRLTLSLKQLQPDPWKDAAKAFEEEQEVSGKVTRISPYGVFVRLVPGIEGLIHISKISPGEEPKVGQEVTCVVEEVDLDSRKISLSLVSKAKPIGYR